MFAEALIINRNGQACTIAIGDEQGVLMPSDVKDRFIGHIGKTMVIANFTEFGPYVAINGVAFAIQRHPQLHSRYTIR